MHKGQHYCRFVCRLLAVSEEEPGKGLSSSRVENFLAIIACKGERAQYVANYNNVSSTAVDGQLFGTSLLRFRRSFLLQVYAACCARSGRGGEFSRAPRPAGDSLPERRDGGVQGGTPDQHDWVRFSLRLFISAVI